MVIPLATLESHLWESANILRDPVDTADFKSHIFPRIFFRGICHFWDVAGQENVDEAGDEQLGGFPGSHRFKSPEDCDWDDLCTKAGSVGAAFRFAMREIEKASPDTLCDVFGDAG